MQLGSFQHLYPSRFGKGGSHLLKVREAQAVSLQVCLSESFMRAEGLSELLPICCLVLAMIETEQAEVVMKEMTQRGEDLAPERLQKPLTRPLKKSFQIRQESVLNHVDVDQAAPQVAPCEVASLDEREIEGVRSTEPYGTYNITLGFFIQHPIIDVPAKAGSIYLPDSLAQRASLLMHTFLQGNFLKFSNWHRLLRFCQIMRE